jgi:hypothetical protein
MRTRGGIKVRSGGKGAESNATEGLIEGDKYLIRVKPRSNYLFVIDNSDPRHTGRVICGSGHNAWSVDQLDVFRIAVKSQNHAGVMKLPCAKLAIRDYEPGVPDRFAERAGRSQEHRDRSDHERKTG